MYEEIKILKLIQKEIEDDHFDRDTSVHEA